MIVQTANDLRVAVPCEVLNPKLIPPGMQFEASEFVAVVSSLIHNSPPFTKKLPSCSYLVFCNVDNLAPVAADGRECHNT